MVDHLIFNLPDLLLDHQLIAQHIVKLGWDGVAEVKNPSASAANCQDNDACNGLLTNAAPKP